MSTTIGPARRQFVLVDANTPRLAAARRPRRHWRAESATNPGRSPGPTLDPGRPETLACLARRYPKVFFCGPTALWCHGLSDGPPDEVWVALPRSLGVPRIESAPVQVVRVSRPALDIGISVNRIDGVAVRLSTPLRAVVECIKFRHRIGIELAQEALRRLEPGHTTGQNVWALAEALRVSTVIRPYLPSSLRSDVCDV